MLIDFGSHMIDLMFALFDEPADALDYRDNALSGIEADCTIDLRVRHAGDPSTAAWSCPDAGAGQPNCGRVRVAMLEFQVNERFRIRVTPLGTEIVDPLSGEPREFWFDAACTRRRRRRAVVRHLRPAIWRLDRRDPYRRRARSVGPHVPAASRLIESCYGRPGPWTSRGCGGA